MKKFEAPDMRVFDQAVAHDHALFDACLVRLCDETSNWTRSTMSGDVPVTMDHFRYDTQRRLVAFLQQVPEDEAPGIARQNFSDNRLLLQHIAHRFTMLSARYLHTWQEPLADLIVHMRTNLNLVTENRKIVLQDEKHPLQGHYRVKRMQASQDGGTTVSMPVIPVKAEDAVITKYIVGPNPHLDSAVEHTERILRQISPFLMEIDTGQLEIKLLEVRRDLRVLLKRGGMFDSKLRKQAIDIVMADWEKQYFADGNAELFDGIAAEVQQQTGTADIFNCDPGRILDECIRKPLSVGQLDAQAVETLRRRQPVLEYLVWQAVEQGNMELLEQLYIEISVYMQKLSLSFGDIEHLGLSAYAAVAHELEDYEKVLG